MKKIKILPLLLALLLAGCAAAPVATTPTPQVAEPTAVPTAVPAPTPTDPPAAALDFRIDESGCEPWQIAYVTFLEALCTVEASISNSIADRAWERQYNLSGGYCLYDVDEDGTPELFLKYGTCEADYYGEGYAYLEGVVTFIGDFSLSHAGFYTWPGKNAILLGKAHMGVHFVEEMTLREGKLVFLEEIFWEDTNGIDGAEYTDEGEIVPGAEYIPLLRTRLGTPRDAALTLPIYEYHAPILQAREQEAVASRAAIETVLKGEGKVFGISADNFCKDTGAVTLEELCAPKAIYEYDKEPWTMEQLAWLDINGDGVEECALRLENEENWHEELCVVLSYQEGVVYAYYDAFSLEFYMLGEDGVFYYSYYDDDESAFTLSFYKNQCYERTAVYVSGVPEVAWEQMQ